MSSDSSWNKNIMYPSQLLVFVMVLCFSFSHDHWLFASLATPIDINRCINSDYSLAVPSLLTSSVPKLKKEVSTFGPINTFATYIFVVITILNIIVYKLRQSHEENYREGNIQSPSSFEKQCGVFTISEIRLATHNFDENLVLGRGGFGKVYKGQLGDGTMKSVAVKRLNSKSRQGAREFWTEIEMLSNFRHSHLVSLIGYCNDENEMILVYEYMPHGTLSDHLYRNRRTGNGVSQPLSWETRLKICIGAARGLDYLHTGTGLQQRVIHRDVKSSNILLDEHWEAKVSDFGLSKIGPANQLCSHVSTNVKGTFGYMDPDYFSTHKLTRKSDVYAFGVVLFEVLCGRSAVDKNIEEDQQILARYAHRCTQEGSTDQIIDSSLRGQITKGCLKVFVEIGDQCLHHQPDKRPTMADVVAKLELAVELQKRTECPVDYMLLMETQRQEDNDTGGVLINLEDDVGGVLCNLEDDAGSILDNQRYLPSLRKKDKGILKLVAKNMFKAISVLNRGKKYIARKKTSNAIFSGSSLDQEAPLPGNSNPSSPNLDQSTQVCQLPFLEIQAATNFFDADLVLTYGHQGMVFKGHFVGGHTEVVIKQLITTSHSREYKSFYNEILHSKINHLHVLPLIGFCCDGYRLYLVSKYMSNGSLDHHLYNKIAPMTWNLRLQICIGVAKGLNYLHTGIIDQIITHGGIKPNKILLDANWIPKISGYGMSKFETSCQELVPAFDFWETWAYTSPEQMAQESLTTKSDVYSMGVVLLNVLFDWKLIIMTLVYLHKPQESLSAWLKNNIRERTLVSFIDQHLEVASECFIEILDTALHCLTKDKYKRPSMEGVVKRLEHALELEKKHTWSYPGDKVKEIESALQIQLQTNKNWSLDDTTDDIEIESALQIQLQTIKYRSLDDTTDDIGMICSDDTTLHVFYHRSWSDDIQISNPSYDFDSMEIGR